MRAHRNYRKPQAHVTSQPSKQISMENVQIPPILYETQTEYKRANRPTVTGVAHDIILSRWAESSFTTA